MEAIVEYNYDAQEPDELTLKRGDIIQEIIVMPGGWWKGTLRDKRGMFPDNFVKVLDPPLNKTAGVKAVGNAKSEEVSMRNGGSKKLFCKVLFDYEPCNKDELSLMPGDAIEFLGEEERGWWRGRLKGKTGVFPSNFVTPPMYEDADKYKDDKKEMCKVLFSYEAASEDELNLTEGDLIMLISKDAPDKGWWIGKLKGKVGLFPDNFVEMVTVATDHQDHEQRHDSKSVAQLSQPVTKSKKAHIRKSLDIENTLTEAPKKIISRRTIQEESSGDIKTTGENSMMLNMKRLDAETNNGNGNATASLAEELDGVERGEGAPLLHLTVSRAKAPRRRPPSSQRLLLRASGSTTTSPTNEDNVANENKETVLEQLREEEPEGLAAKARRKAPWVEELKLNQLERKKGALIDQLDKSNIKKDRNFINMTAMTFLEVISQLEAVDEESKSKNKNHKSETSPHLESTSPSSGTPAYVPYAVYNQLLERVATLEEKQATMLQTMVLILKQFVSLHYSGNSPTDQ